MENQTPISKGIVDSAINALGIKDLEQATIREVKSVAARAEKESGVNFIKLEMGIPGIPAPRVGVDAQIAALDSGIANSYPDIQGCEPLKREASRFVKAFVGVDIDSRGCIPVCGSMQGTFAAFLTCSQVEDNKDTVLFIDPGFPVQKMQLQVLGIKHEAFDVYDFRGDKLAGKLEEYLAKGNICAIVYSNPNNPSWVCLDENELRSIGNLATKYDTIVMEDLAYFAMDSRKPLGKPFTPPYQSTVARYTDNYMLFISGSKAFSYAGERIGVVCIGDNLFGRHFPALDKRYEGLPFGLVYSTRMLYAMSSGTSHSAQYALAAMMKASSDGKYDFRRETDIYGRRAKKLKKIFCSHGFHIVYDKDLDEDIADGFYFTIGYPGLTCGQLAHELLYYGVSAICLSTTGSHRQGLRVCTSFVDDDQLSELDRRMSVFHENHPF